MDDRSKRNTGRRWRVSVLLATALVQIAIMVIAYQVSKRYIANYVLICEFISFCTTLYILREDANPSYKLPWVALTAFLPIVSGFIYLLFGKAHLSRKERRRFSAIIFDYHDAMDRGPDASGELQKSSTSAHIISEYLRKTSGSPVYQNTLVNFYPSGEKMLPDMLEAIRGARESVYVEYFIIKEGLMWDSIHELLREKAASGLDVRVMYDDIGSFDLSKSFCDGLKKEGIRACAFNPFRHVIVTRLNNRDHRKFLIIDGRTAFTGGINIGDEYINEQSRFGYWKDSGLRISGDAVWAIREQFFVLWDANTGDRSGRREYKPSGIASKGFVQPFIDNPMGDERVGESVYSTIIRRSNRYCYISTPYLVIDDEIINALAIAAKSGVDVRLLTPGKPDKKLTNMLTRSYYDQLLRAGVRIFELNGSFVHAKHCVSDDRMAMVGTINLDYRSFRHHFENAVWLYDSGVEADIKADFMDAFERSKEFTLDTMSSHLTLCRRPSQAVPLPSGFLTAR